MKIIIARFLLPVVTFWAILLPSQVYANPLIIGSARVVAAVIKNPVGAQMALGTAVIAIGTLIKSIQISREDASGTKRDDEILITNSLRNPSTAEAAAGMSAGFPHVAPPASSTLFVKQTCWLNTAWIGQGSDRQGACNNALIAMNAASAPDVWTVSQDCNTTSCSFTKRNSAGGFLTGGMAAYGTFNFCAAGYTYTSGSCSLTAPDSVARPSDGYCPIVRINNAYGVDTTDPDCAVSGATPQISPDGTAQITGADGVTFNYSVPSAGKHKLKISTPDPATNTTKIREITASDGATAADPLAVTGVQDSVVQGTGDAVTGTPAAQTTDMGPTVAAINAQTAAVQAQTAQEKAWNDGDQARKDADKGVAPVSELIPKESIPVSISSTVFASAAGCPADIPLTVYGHTYAISYSPMCNLASYLRPMFLAMGAFGAAFIFIGGLKT